MLFKKKKDEFDFDDKLGDPLSSEPTSSSINDSLTENNEELGMSSKISNNKSSFDSLHETGTHNNSFQNQNENQNNQIQNTNNNEYQIMNAKLDAIKSELDALRQHILGIENNLNQNKKKPMW